MLFYIGVSIVIKKGQVIIVCRPQVWLTVFFSSFFVTQIMYLLSKLGKPLRITVFCTKLPIYLLSFSTPKNVDFAHQGPIVKFHTRLHTFVLFAMGIFYNGQNKHFTELRQKVDRYIQKLVLLRGFPSLDGNKLFVTYGYQYDRVSIVFKNLCILVLQIKGASALLGL